VGKTDYIVVLVTVPSRQEGETIASSLVAERLCACVNIVDGLTSFFWWENKIDKAAESLLIIKTRQELLDKLTARVQSLHSYTCPEVIALPVVGGSKGYLDWIDESIGHTV
jgi:periplasmic divalent cation tolerance protein